MTSPHALSTLNVALPLGPDQARNVMLKSSTLDVRGVVAKVGVGWAGARRVQHYIQKQMQT